MAAEGKPGPSGKAGNMFGNTISFRTPTQALPMEYNPRKLFYSLFGRGDLPAEREALMSETSSILDFTMERAAAYRQDAGRDRPCEPWTTISIPSARSNAA